MFASSVNLLLCISWENNRFFVVGLFVCLFGVFLFVCLFLFICLRGFLVNSISEPEYAYFNTNYFA